MITVPEVIEKLATTRSNSEKVAILRQHQDVPYLKEALRFALDPYLVYGIKQFRTSETYAPEKSSDWPTLFGTLQALNDRLVTGDAARAAAAKSIMSAPDTKTAEIWKRIVLKDLRCGVGASTVNKVWPGWIPEFDVALAETFEDKRAFWPAITEIKWDGYRAIASLENGRAILRSRNGLEIDGYGAIKEAIESLPMDDTILDGELMVGMFGDRKSQESKAVFRVFDMLHIEDWKSQTCLANLTTRKERLFQTLDIDQIFPETFRQLHSWSLDMAQDFLIIPSAHLVAYNQDELMGYYEEAISLGHEGLMLKNPQSFYKWDRGWDWLKLKPVKDVDLKIIGTYLGEAGKEFEHCLGGLIVDFNGVEVGVGSGFSKQQREDFWNKREFLVGKTVEVRYTEVTPDGSLRFPRFVRFREDK